MKKILATVVVIVGTVYISTQIFIIGLFLSRFKLDNQISVKFDRCVGVKSLLEAIKLPEVELKKKWNTNDYNKYTSLKEELKECNNKSEAEKILELITRPKFMYGVPFVFGIGMGTIISWSIFWKNKNDKSGD